MTTSNSSGKSTGSGHRDVAMREWVRIPDKTTVRHRLDDHQGAVDGLTEIVTGPKRNPDGRTQYRIDVGQPQRLLAAEEDLVILLDDEDLIMMNKEKIEYRRGMTERLRGVFREDRFCRATPVMTNGRVKGA
ncbi:MAG: hypothetical protein ACREIH_00580 [Nitrospiraceae bacterium]